MNAISTGPAGHPGFNPMSPPLVTRRYCGPPPVDHPPDLVLLGLGDDGHTASLFPDTTALTAEGRWFVGNEVPQLKTWRLTATIPFLHRATRLVFLISGASKAAMLARVANGDDLPTTRVANGPAPTTFLIDKAAAARLP